MRGTSPSPLEQVCELITTRMHQRSRALFAIVGPPASGKSTLAASVVDALNTAHPSAPSHPAYAALVPMDGFHIDNNILAARGHLAHKGAPHTFDAYGLCAAIERLAAAQEECYVPRFDRDQDQAIAAAVAVSAHTPVVVVEGNYLLLNQQPWARLRDLFCASVMLRPSDDILRQRLVHRWIEYGLTPAAAAARADDNDLPNATLVVSSSSSATLVVQQ